MAERIKFYMDEHVPRAVTQGLRRRGVDVLTAKDAGMLEAADERHLAFASEESRAILTQDADFLRLRAAGHRHRGIVYAPLQTGIGAINRRGCKKCCWASETRPSSPNLAPMAANQTWRKPARQPSNRICNRVFESLFDGHAQVPTRGLVATSRFVLGAIFVYQPTLLYRFRSGEHLRVGLKAFLKAA